MRSGRGSDRRWPNVPAAADRALLDALAALDRTLRRLAVPAMIIGGIAVIARGVPRQTVDIDATIWGEAITVDRLVAELARHGTGIDLARVRAVIEEFATVLDEPERLDEFDALVRRSGEAAE